MVPMCLHNRVVSRIHTVPADSVINSGTDKLATSRGISVHKFSDEKIVVSFPYHKEALRAMKLGGPETVLQINGCPYRFTMGDERVHLRSIFIVQRVHLTLRKLLPQMWTCQIVE